MRKLSMGDALREAIDYIRALPAATKDPVTAEWLLELMAANDDSVRNDVRLMTTAQLRAVLDARMALAGRRPGVRARS